MPGVPAGDAVPDQATLVFMPSGLRGRFSIGTPVLQAAQELGVDLASVCGGHGLCGRCQFIPAEGEFPKHGLVSRRENLSSPAAAENNGLASGLLLPGRRLGCSARILGDLVVDVPADSQLHQQKIVKEAGNYQGEMEPAVELFTLTISPPDMQYPVSDSRRLQRALETSTGVTSLTWELPVLQQLQTALRKGDWTVTLALYRRQWVIAIWPGIREGVYGLAVDLGSTSIAAHLCNLNSGEVISSATAMNPQIRFGEDLMSRVSYVMMNENGDREMTRVVRDALNGLARDTARMAGLGLDQIFELMLVGNPIMHHLFLGIDPTPLGSAPFALATDSAVTLKARTLDLNLHPEARVTSLPCLAGHIGADCAGVILAERPDLSDEMTLLVDVGTNAEIVLGNRHRLLAASSPTGPAFEGAQISCGQRAAPGAIERVRIDRESLEPRFKVIGCDLWSDEPGFREQIARVGVSGVCGSGIIELLAEMFLAGIVDRNGVFDSSLMARCSRIQEEGRTHAYLLHAGSRPLRLTQKDVRAIQLAKAALYAGTRLLMDHMGIERPDRIAIAGAFGSHIDAKYAMVLGLIPDCDLSHVSSVGNAAGKGALIALLNHRKRSEIEALLRQVEKIETAVEPAFQEHFVNAMAIPHRSDRFEQLARVVSLPETRIDNNRGVGRGRRGPRRQRR